MEAKLREYRAQRRRKELIENTKHKIEDAKEKIIKFLTPKFLLEMSKEKNEDEVLLLENEHTSQPNIYDPPESPESDIIEPEVEENTESWRKFTLRWTIYIGAWLTFYAFFLQIQFGAVFFAISLLVGIYFNTRTRPRRKGEASAYSVFNQNCDSIDGTLKAEDLEKQLVYGGRIF